MLKLKFKLAAILLGSLFSGHYSQAQCTIPNGEFEEFETIFVEDLLGNISTYELPLDWVESPPLNIVTRFLHSVGFFGRYTGDDANGSALYITRSAPGSFQNINNGYIRFECSEVPNKLKGRITFSGSSNRDLGQQDRITIGAFFSTTEDSLSVVDELYPSHFPERAKYFITEEPIEEFTDFEIDLSDFIGTGADYSYFTVMIKMEIIDPISFGEEYATAVLDDVHFEYDALSIEQTPDEKTQIYPNPTSDVITVSSSKLMDATNIVVKDVTGRLIGMNKILRVSPTQLQINLSSSPSGIYFLQIQNASNTTIERIIKNRINGLNHLVRK